MANDHAHSHTALIWKVFAFLSVVTIVEVFLGIKKPDFLYLTHFFNSLVVNTFSIFLSSSFSFSSTIFTIGSNVVVTSLYAFLYIV